MVGPRDPSQRFTWWPYRFLRAMRGDASPVVLGPGAAGRAVQYSDARAIAQWMVRRAIDGAGGTFNTVGPLRYESLDEVLHACRTAAAEHVVASSATGSGTPGTPGYVEWAEDEQQLRVGLAGVEEEQRPLWYPEDQIPQQAIDSRAAFAAGLRFRSALSTARETLHWAIDNGQRPLDDFREPRR